MYDYYDKFHTDLSVGSEVLFGVIIQALESVYYNVSFFKNKENGPRYPLLHMCQYIFTWVPECIMSINKNSATSHFRAKVELEHSNTQVTIRH
jgi:hypothetical protein